MVEPRRALVTQQGRQYVLLYGEVSYGLDRLAAAVQGPCKVWGSCEGCCDLSPEVTPREGFVLCQDRDWFVLESEGGESHSQSLVSVPSGKALQGGEEGCNTAFGDVGVNARPCAELVDAVVELDHGAYGGRDEGAIVGEPDAGHRVRLGDGVSEAVVFDPPDEGLESEGKDKGGEGVALESSSFNRDRWGGAVGGEEDGGGGGVEVADEVDEVGGEAQEFEDASE